MEPWVVIILSIAVAVFIGARPLCRLGRPEKNDRLMLVLSIAIIGSGVAFASGDAYQAGGANIAMPDVLPITAEDVFRPQVVLGPHKSPAIPAY